jgi:hypothetical protein
MSAFDDMAVMVVDTTSDVFGDLATWVKDGSHTYTALVKFKDMPGQAEIGESHRYGLDKWSIEIKDKDFPGLKDLIDQNNKVLLTVTVRGTATQYYGVSADPLSDGLCTLIRLRLKP